MKVHLDDNLSESCYRNVLEKPNRVKVLRQPLQFKKNGLSLIRRNIIGKKIEQSEKYQCV